jgi:hypothetical protein
LPIVRHGENRLLQHFSPERLEIEIMETAINPSETHTELGVVTGGLSLEALGGVAVAALAILALVGVQPALLTTIGGIVFGAAMLVAGIAIAGAWSRLGLAMARTGEQVELGGGAGVEMLVGLAAVALGILSLIGIAPATLMPALVITGGVGLILSAGTTQRLNDLRMISDGASETTRHLMHQAVEGSAVAQALGGIGALVLGILALVAVPPAAAAGYGSLTQIGILVLGATIAIAGGALTGRLGNLLRGI